MLVQCSAAAPHHLDADPGPAFHFNADLDPASTPHQFTANLANLQLLAFRSSLQSVLLCLHFASPQPLNLDFEVIE